MHGRLQHEARAAVAAGFILHQHHMWRAAVVHEPRLVRGMHTNRAAGLLCLKTAKAGGESSWSSSVAVHNELLRLGRPDLVEALSGPWCAARWTFSSVEAP